MVARLRFLLEFAKFMNSRHPNIKFTIEHPQQNKEQSVSYLYLSVSVEIGFLSWELFMKPSHSGVHLSYDSALPVKVKRSVALEKFRRSGIQIRITVGTGEERRLRSYSWTMITRMTTWYQPNRVQPIRGGRGPGTMLHTQLQSWMPQHEELEYSRSSKSFDNQRFFFAG